MSAPRGCRRQSWGRSSTSSRELCMGGALAQRAHFGRSVGSRGDKKPPRLVVDKGGLGGNPRHIKCMWHDIPRHTEILSPLQC